MNDQPQHEETRGPGAAEARWRRDLEIAAAELTAWPAARSSSRGRATKAADVARSRRAVPIVATVLGLAAAIVYAFGQWLGLYGLASAALAFGAIALMTAGRGEAGLAAFAERAAAGGAGKKARAGPGYTGVTAIAVSLFVRIGLVAGVAFADAGAAVLFAALAGSRILMVLASGLDPGDRAGDADPLTRPEGRDALWIVALVGVLLLILFLGFWPALITAAAGAAAATAVGLAAWRLGPLDRPALWSIQQGSEIGLLVAAVAMV